MTTTATATIPEEQKLGFKETFTLNMLNMFGTGPFITLPFLLDSVTPAGPQALIGYATAAGLCFVDSMVWAELGGLWPESGGTQTYLLRTFNNSRLGELLAFLFTWQFLLAGPLEVASGFVAVSAYLQYLTGPLHWALAGLIGALFCGGSALLLVSNRSKKYAENLANSTMALGVGSVAAMAFAIIGGFAMMRSSRLETPYGAFGPGSSFDSRGRKWDSSSLPFALGLCMRIGIYDFTGYFDVNFIGNQVRDAKNTIPRACMATCVGVGIIYFLLYIAVIGATPWDGKDGFVQQCSEKDKCYTGAIFAERMGGPVLGVIFALVVVYTIVGSCFALLVGYAEIPMAAARDGLFFQWFAVVDSDGRPTRSVIFVGVFASLLCFAQLDVLIEAVATTRLVAQFAMQAIGLWRYRITHPDVERPFKVPLHPLPEIICICGFGFVFLTTQNWIFHGEFPLLECGVLVFLVGVLVFFICFPNGRREIVATDDVKSIEAGPSDKEREQNKTLADLTSESSEEKEKPLEPAATSDASSEDVELVDRPTPAAIEEAPVESNYVVDDGANDTCAAMCLPTSQPEPQSS